jgi:hypothetical protein
MAERRIPRWAPVAVVAVAAAAAAFAVSGGPQPTSAAWTASKAFAGTATAVTPAPPTGLSCPGLGVLSGGIPFTWTAPAGTAPSGYTLTWTRLSTTNSLSTTTTSATIPSAGFALLQVWTVRAYSDYGSWRSASSNTRTVTILLDLGVTSYTCG